MKNSTVAQIDKTKVKKIGLTWTSNPFVQKLLDVIAIIIAEEYIRIAKENPELFKEIGSQK